MGDDFSIGALLPLLTARELWVVGAVVVLGVLRPVGRLGWSVAGALLAGAITAIVASAGPWLDAGLWLLLPWVVLAGLLAATAAGSPLRWEPRSGPSAATALLVGALVIHVGAAWHGRGGVLAEVAEAWGSGDLTAAQLGSDAAGPLAPALAWLVSRVPGLDGAAAVAVLSLAAVALTVAAASVLARSWGYTGTSRATAAAVAWAPPLLVAYGVAPGALLACAALVWSWWALAEVWAGRHLPDRMALLAGGLLGVAVGIGLWPLVVAPLWLRRLGGRKLGWFVVGFVAVMVVSVGALIPTQVGLVDVWDAGVTLPAARWGIAVGWAAVPVVAALASVLRRVPFTPTRLSAVSGALLILTLPWWPDGWVLAGPVLATPFVLLAAVAPDRPQERWPPDAPVNEEPAQVEAAS
ncbi:MAG TPA: hypothetical protein VGA69_06555 [Nitriliruptorales bacterium]